MGPGFYGCLSRAIGDEARHPYRKRAGSGSAHRTGVVGARVDRVSAVSGEYGDLPGGRIDLVDHSERSLNRERERRFGASRFRSRVSRGCARGG